MRTSFTTHNGTVGTEYEHDVVGGVAELHERDIYIGKQKSTTVLVRVPH